LTHWALEAGNYCHAGIGNLHREDVPGYVVDVELHQQRRQVEREDVVNLVIGEEDEPCRGYPTVDIVLRGMPRK
jgi:hypothetical protein